MDLVGCGSFVGGSQRLVFLAFSGLIHPDRPITSESESHLNTCGVAQSQLNKIAS